MEKKKNNLNSFLKSKEISWLKKNKFVLAKDSKKVAFFHRSKKISIDNNILFKVASISKKYKINFRLNLHKNSKDELHDMIMISRKGTTSDIHLHKKYYTTYHLIKGKVDFTFYNKKGGIQKKDSMNNKKKIIIKIPPKIFRSHKTLSEISIFHETRKGPYKRSDIEKL